MKNEKTEKQIVNEILKYLNSVDKCRAVKIHGGMYGNAGEPDIDCVYKGRAIKIEVKRKGNKPSKIQEIVLDQWSRAGALSAWVTDVEQVKMIIQSLS